MGNPFRRIESPASTALQVIEAHRLFHLVTVIVHGKAMHCRSNCRAMLFYAYCAMTRWPKSLTVKDCPVRPRVLYSWRIPPIVTYKIYYVLETVPVVQNHKHFDKERTLPHKFELNHYLIF